MTDTFDLPPGRELACRNRHVIAARVGWPDGAAEACEMIEMQHPDWYPNWWGGGSIWQPEPGFYARRWDSHRDDKALYGPTAWELTNAIDEWKRASAVLARRRPWAS